MDKFIVTSRELRDDRRALLCESRQAAHQLVTALTPSQTAVYAVEVTPIVLFLPSGAKVQAYKPLPPLGTRKAVR